MRLERQMKNALVEALPGPERAEPGTFMNLFPSPQDRVRLQSSQRLSSLTPVESSVGGVWGAVFFTGILALLSAPLS